MKAHYKRKVAALVAVVALAISGSAMAGGNVDDAGNSLKRVVKLGNSL